MEIWSCRECVREHGYLWRIDSPFSVYSVCQHLAVRTFQKFMTCLLELCTHRYTRLCTRHTNQSAFLAPHAHGEGCVSLNWKISSFFLLTHDSATFTGHAWSIENASCAFHVKAMPRSTNSHSVCSRHRRFVAVIQPRYRYQIFSLSASRALYEHSSDIIFCFKARAIFPNNVKNTRNDSRKAILGGLLKS